MTKAHPIVVAELLQLRTAARRIGWRRVSAFLVLVVAVMAVALGLYAPELRQAAVHAGLWTERYALFVAALVAVNAAILVSRSKRLRVQLQQSSWLAAAPFEARSVRRWILLRVALTALCVLAVIVVALVMVRTLAGNAVPQPPVVGLIGGGFIVGCVAGWFWRQRHLSRYVASRYVPRFTKSATGDVLSRWPIAQALAWHRPEHSRFLLAAALLAVQGGSTIVVGLGVVGFWLLGTYLVVLLHSTFVVGREAATWLQATPVSFARFAWPLARRMLVHQAVGALAASGIGLMLGAPPAMLAWLLVLWMTLTATATAVSLADSYRRRYAPFKWTFIAIAAALAELRHRGSGIAFALLVAAVHVITAVRSTGEWHDRRA